MRALPIWRSTILHPHLFTRDVGGEAGAGGVDKSYLGQLGDGAGSGGVLISVLGNLDA